MRSLFGLSIADRPMIGLLPNVPHPIVLRYPIPDQVRFLIGLSARP